MKTRPILSWAPRIEALESRQLFAADLLQSGAMVRDVAELAEIDSGRIMSTELVASVETEATTEAIGNTEIDAKLVDATMAKLSPSDNLESSRDSNTSQANDPKT